FLRREILSQNSQRPCKVSAPGIRLASDSQCLAKCSLGFRKLLLILERHSEAIQAPGHRKVICAQQFTLNCQRLLAKLLPCSIVLSSEEQTREVFQNVDGGQVSPPMNCGLNSKGFAQHLFALRCRVRGKVKVQLEACKTAQRGSQFQTIRR